MRDKKFENKKEDSMPLMRPADIILAAVLVAVGFVFSFFVSFGGDEGNEVKVTVAGEDYGVYSLLEDRDVDIGRPAGNTFRIKDGKVKMIEATCSGGDCLHEGEISKTGETIICLPHKVVIEVTGGEEGFDAVSE